MANYCGLDIDPTEDQELLAFLKYGGVPTKRVSKLAENYRLIDGELYFEIDNDLKYVPPVGLRTHFIKKVHYWGCHPGLKRTLKLITERFFWPRMTSAVAEVVACCFVCQ